MMTERAADSESRTEDLRRRYRRDGYVVVEDSGILDDVDVAAIWNDLGTHYAAGAGRLQDAWQTSSHVRRIAVHPVVLDLLRALYGREPIPFQTLNFLYGTEQATHSDTIHFSSQPYGFMCGVWVALEDITLRQGPLHYYEGSHVLPAFDYEDLGIPSVVGPARWENPQVPERYAQYEQKIDRLARLSGFPRRRFAIKKGSLLIWSANLLHGGDPREDAQLTRKSQVTHYYFADTVRTTPMFSRKSQNSFLVRTIVDLRSGEPVPNTLDGEPVVCIPVDDVRSQIVPARQGYHRALALRYMDRYPDVRAAYADPELAYLHYVQHGVGEGRTFFG